MRGHVRLVLRISIVACCGLTGCAQNNAGKQSHMTTEARLQVAQAADAAGNGELAISMYRAAAADKPDDIELQLRCADALARRGKITDARALLTDRLRTHPGQPDLMRAMALVDLAAGQPAQAIEGLDKVLAASPGDTRALVDKGVALDLQGQHAAAQALYRQVLAASPDDAATRNDLAVSLMLEGRTQQALDTLAPMRDADNSPQRLKVNLGLLYATTGDAERSRQLLGDRVSSGELSAFTQALASAGRTGQ